MRLPVQLSEAEVEVSQQQTSSNVLMSVNNYRTGTHLTSAQQPAFPRASMLAIACQRWTLNWILMKLMLKGLNETEKKTSLFMVL